MHHRYMKEACVDIDGVLCMDPLPKENDDGARYIDFIRNATILLLTASSLSRAFRIEFPLIELSSTIRTFLILAYSVSFSLVIYICFWKSSPDLSL
mgnify:CR=1 FL=1